MRRTNERKEEERRGFYNKAQLNDQEKEGMAIMRSMNVGRGIVG